MINVNINGYDYEVEEGSTILQAAQENGIDIPNLCYLKDVHQCGSCRVCVVEVEGARNLQASCVTKVRDGMVVRTNTPKVRKTRQMLYELLLSDHNKECLICGRNGNCELQDLGERLQVDNLRFEDGEKSKEGVIEFSNPSILRDMSKCILCRRCETVCNEIQGVGAISSQNRGFKSTVAPSGRFELASVNCAYCGQCTMVCPVGALMEVDSTRDVWKALSDPKKRVIVQTAPAIRAALGEEFGYEPGTLVTGKMAAALRRMGFDDIFDTNFAADLTILEEGTEFLSRVGKLLGEEEVTLPMITSCSPGWIRYIEQHFPDLLGHLSTCKSPHMMLGAVAKSYYADKLEIDPADIYVVSVMPCTAKKFEITREEMINDVDAVITTRELAKMIKEAGIDFVNLKEENFDIPFGISSGAADIFGTTGGVMEAALRTVYEIITGEQLPFENLHVQPIMGLEGIKEGSITFDKTTDAYAALKGQTVRVAVASGLDNARVLLEQMRDGKSPYLFVEIMCCPGGCISGGGQPRPTNQEIREKRLEAIYKEDESKELRKSHDNPLIKKLYEEFLETPNSHLAHDILHTHYVPREKYSS